MHSNKLQYKETSLSLSVFFFLFTWLCSCCVHLRDSVHTSRARQRSLRALSRGSRETRDRSLLRFNFSFLAPFSHNAAQFFRPFFLSLPRPRAHYSLSKNTEAVRKGLSLSSGGIISTSSWPLVAAASRFTTDRSRNA